MKNSFLERRVYPRLNQDMPLKLLLEGFDVEAESRNISASGLYCRVSKHFELMTKLKIIMFLPSSANKKIICSGVVVRTEVDSDGDNHIAIFFTDIKKTDQQKIAEYIKQNLC
ncbi:MAG: PilZ domain-containing protein [Candidatus Omnitrophota bacterium]